MCAPSQKKKATQKHPQSVSFEWQLMGLCQTFKDQSVSEAFLCVCVSPLISNGPCFWLWSTSISVFSWSLPSPPLPNLYTAPLYYSIFWTAVWLCDTWQVQVQLWSVFCKESLAAENAAVSRRFTAQSLQSISLAGFFLRAGGDRDVSLHCLLSHTFHYQFIYFIL